MQAIETSSTIYFHLAKKEKKILKKNNLGVLNGDFLESLAHYLPH